MVLVNQNCRFLAIWLQSSLYNTKIEDLVTIGNKIFVSSSIDPLLILIQLEDLIQFKKKNYASRLHNPNFLFNFELPFG